LTPDWYFDQVERAMDAFNRPANAEAVASAAEDGGRGSGEEDAVSLWRLNLGCVAYFARRAR
jgi:hypothetical protein